MKKYKVTIELSINEMKEISRLISTYKKIRGSWLFTRWADAIASVEFK